MFHIERGYRYYLQYHIAWCCYKQKELLSEDTIGELQHYFKELCLSKGISIVSAEIKSNYVYLILDCHPKHIIPDLLKSLKGLSARYIMKNDSRMKEVAPDGLWDGINIVGTNESVLEELKIYMQKKNNKTDYSDLLM